MPTVASTAQYYLAMLNKSHNTTNSIWKMNIKEN